MFSKRWLINYLLFTLIIIFTWIGMKYPVQQNGDAKVPRLTQLKAQDIDSIKIETADQIIELKKQSGSWYLQSPLNWFANNIAAERLATLASVETQSALPRDQIDIATLGLRIPKAVVTLNQQSIFFGDTNRIGNRRYLMVEPDVYLVNDIHYPFINQGVTGMLDTRLLPSALDLESLSFSKMTLTKQAGQWTSNQAQHNTNDIQQLINNWQKKQASKISPIDEALSPLQKISAKLTNGNTIEFHLLSIQPEIIIARPDLKLQYHFADFNYYALLSLDKPEQSSAKDNAVE